jgi:hypothetical protein
MSASSSSTPVRGISVALATYNGQVHLEAQLDSIARQSLLPAELVVCDDVSTDGTVPLLEAFARRAPFPVHIHRNPERLGVLNNFHRVFSFCTHEFIAYCDQDDVWAPEKLARCHAALTQPGVVLASHSSRLTDSDLRPLGIVQPDSIDPGRYRFPHFPLCYWGFGHQMVFARRLLPVIDRIRFTASSDSVPISTIDALIPIAAGMVGDTVFIPEGLINFRRHERAVTIAFSTPNQSDSSKSAVIARLVGKRLTLNKQRQTISAVRNWLAEQELEASDDGGDWARYTAHLDRTLRAVETRLALHSGSDPLSRAWAFAKALASRAYRDPRRGGAGRNQILVDLIAVLRPARESAKAPIADATQNLG